MDNLGTDQVSATNLIRELRDEISQMKAILARAGMAKRRSQLANSLKDDLLKPATLREKLELITESVIQIFEADFCRIWLIKSGDKCESGCVHAKIKHGPHVCHARNNCLHLMASSGRYTHLDGQHHSRVPFDCYKIGRIASGAEPRLLTNDVCSDERIHNHQWAQNLGLVSFGGYRIVSGSGVPIGVLALFSKSPLCGDDNFLLESIANTTAHVIQTATMEEVATSERLKFQRLANNSPFGILMIEEDGLFSYANPKFTEMFGYDLNDVPNGRTWFRKAYPNPTLRHEAINSWLTDFKRRMPGETAPKVFPVICKDGTEMIIHFRNVKLESSQNLLTAEDITELKKAEDTMRLNEARLKKIVEILQYKPDSIQDFRNFALNEAVDITHSKIGYIFHYSEITKQFTLNTWSKNVLDECSIADPQTVYELQNTGIWGEPVRQRQPLIMNDFQAEHPLKKGYPEGHAKLHKYMTIPVFSKGEIVAVVGVANKESDYNQIDLLQLSLLMDSVWKGIDRLVAEEALYQSEATLSTVLQSAPIAIGMVTNRVFEWINDTMTQMTGYSGSELLGRSARLLYETDEEFLRVGSIKYGLIKEKGSGSIETRWKCKDGSVIDIILSSSAIVPGDLSKGVVYSALDITERKRSEHDLREAEERLRLLIESSPIAIRIATQGKYSYVNPAFLRLFGYDSAKDIEGLPVDTLYVEEDRRLIRERNENRARGVPVDSHYTVRGIRKCGSLLDLEAWGSEIIYKGQRSTLRFLINVTESNSLRAQLIQAQKMEAVGTLAGGIAHDFNNLLQTILGYSEFMLQRKDAIEPIYNNIEKIYHAANRGADLVKGLLTLSQKVEIKYAPTDLNLEIEQVRQLLSRTIPKTIRIDLKLSDDLNLINAAESQICQVLMNIAVNARDAMPDGGSLTIETSNFHSFGWSPEAICEMEPGDYVLLTISDTGVGMSATTLSRVFEPFFTTKEVGKGTGLGLATVYGIVKQHGGEIVCLSKLGLGTTFKIYFPAIQSGIEPTAKNDETEVLGGTETILLVEDDDAVRELCQELLSSFGYEVITACNGLEALGIYVRDFQNISLVILDLIMPVMDGSQCFKEILRINPAAKVIIASGYSENEIATQKSLSSSRSFIRKPYNMNEMLNSVRRILDDVG